MLRERIAGEVPADRILDDKSCRCTGYIVFDYFYGCCCYEFEAEDGQIFHLRKEDLQ